MKVRMAGVAALAAVTAGLGTASAASAATTVTVGESSVTRQTENTPPTDNWVLYTRAGTPPTAGAFVEGPATPPLGTGSFQMSTATGAEKVFLFNYDHVGTDLDAIAEIGYSTYRQTGTGQQVAALNLQVDHNGAAEGGFTTLVFEPVYNTDQGTVVNGSWQDWDATGDARWWSTRPIPGVCAFDCFVSWNDIKAANSDATIVGGVGVNQGSGNGGLTSNVDAFTFDETTYDFEVVGDEDGDGVPDVDDTDSKEDCKNGGYARFTNPEFKNQGECVSYFARM